MIFVLCDGALLQVLRGRQRAVGGRRGAGELGQSKNLKGRAARQKVS
jgi:hypothetical protein